MGQTICDAIVYRTAVCKGIAKTMQYMLRQLRCFSTLSEGTLDGAARHVWNIVDIEGRYYHADVCMGYAQFDSLFDEAKKQDQHRCFVVSDAELSHTHGEST